MTSPIILRVVGDPNAPKGSGRAMLIGGKARHIASGSGVNAKKQKAWATAVASTWIERFADFLPFVPTVGSEPLGHPCGVACAIVFRFPMRKGDLDGIGGPKQSAPFGHVVKPDADKLVRATLDALTTAGAWCDDSQVMPLAFKAYVPPGEATGAWIALAPFGVTGAMDVSGLHEVTRLWTLEIANCRAEILLSINEANRDREARRRRPKHPLVAVP